MPDVLVNKLMPASPPAAAPPPPAHSILWVPGLWGFADGFLGGGRITPDLAALAAANTTPTSGTPWVGYGCFTYWAQFENSLGVYTWSTLDSFVSACAAQGMQAIIQLNLGDFAHAPSQGAMPTGGGGDYIPQYILQNATYGGALVGNTGLTLNGGAPYGFFVGPLGSGGASTANYTNANVMARIQALANAMGTRYNSNPNFYGVILCAWDVMEPDSGCGITSAQYFGTQPGSGLSSGRELILQYFKTAFPNRNIANQSGFSGPDGNATIPQQHMDWSVRNAIMPSCSDSIGLSEWSGNDASISAFTNTGGSLVSITGGGTVGNLGGGNGWFVALGQTYLMTFLDTGQTVSATLNTSTTCAISPAVTGNPSLSNSNVHMAFAPNRLDSGIQAWLGQASGGSSYTPPGTPLQSYGSAFLQAQGGDFSDASNPVYPRSANSNYMVDILNAYNQKYKNSHCFFTILYNSDYTNPSDRSATFSNIASTLAGVGVTNTAYPSVYP